MEQMEKIFSSSNFRLMKLPVEAIENVMWWSPPRSLVSFSRVCAILCRMVDSLQHQLIPQGWIPPSLPSFSFRVNNRVLMTSCLRDTYFLQITSDDDNKPLTLVFQLI